MNATKRYTASVGVWGSLGAILSGIGSLLIGLHQGDTEMAGLGASGLVTALLALWGRARASKKVTW